MVNSNTIRNTNSHAVSKMSTPVWGMRMVSQDYIGFNDQLVLALSDSQVCACVCVCVCVCVEYQIMAYLHHGWTSKSGVFIVLEGYA